MKSILRGSRARTIAGLVVLAGLAPFLLALMACLEVPVGDPETSRVDPALSGVWRSESKGESGGLWIIEPWDARTWIVTVLWAGNDDAADEAASTATTEGPAQAGQAELESQGAYKAWLATFNGVRFLVLEPKQVVRETEGMNPDMWMVFKTAQPSADRLELRLVGPDLFDEVETTAEADAILAKHANDPELVSSGESDAYTLRRVPESEYGGVEEQLEALGIFAY
jgi:hypothetical protein